MAYEQLLSEGYIEARACRGYYAARLDGLYQLTEPDTVKKEKKNSDGKKYEFDFTPYGVDLKSFPYNIWRRLSRECLIDDRAELFRLGDPRGEYGLRNAICSYLHQARGVNCSPSRLLSGRAATIFLCCLRRSWDRDTELPLRILLTGRRTDCSEICLMKCVRLIRMIREWRWMNWTGQERTSRLSCLLTSILLALSCR